MNPGDQLVRVEISYSDFQMLAVAMEICEAHWSQHLEKVSAEGQMSLQMSLDNLRSTRARVVEAFGLGERV